MSNMSTSTGITWTGVSVPIGESPAPAKTPKVLIATRAVEMKDGWVGQVIICGEVVQENAGWETAEDAEHWATGVVVDVMQGLFAVPKDDDAGEPDRA